MGENSRHRRPPPSTAKVMSSAMTEFLAAMIFIFGMTFVSVYVILFHLV